MIKAAIAVIGGSGLYNIPGVRMLERVHISTPFGEPSDDILIFEIGDRAVAFLPRHGIGHRVNPSHVNYRANIFALKQLGVSTIISVSAVGSLKEEISPRDFVIPDQIIDRTKNRANSFFDPFAIHVGFADPFCLKLSALLAQTGRDIGVKTHEGGVYVCMEGPLFSTKAESAMHRSWGASLIGMTALPEAKLAREAEMCYATVGLVTDYDVWKDNEEVEIASVLENIRSNTENVKHLIRMIVPQIHSESSCKCRDALKNAFITDPASIPRQIRKDWQPLIGKYIQE